MNDTINRYLSILCYPFASLDFFIEDYFEQMAEDKGGSQKTEDRLREAVIRHIQRNGTVYSYDEIYLYLEKCYLFALRSQKYKSAGELYLDSLCRMMDSMISQRDGKIVFKYWGNKNDGDFLGGFGEANKIFIFHSLNMQMPLDFIVMLYLAQNPNNDIYSLDHYYGQIEVADQQLAGVLRAGVAENHLHKGVSVSFFEIWDNFMQPISSYSIRAFESIRPEWRDAQHRESELLFYILTAAIVRIWIAMALRGFSCNKAELKQPEAELLKLIRCFEDGRGLRDWYRNSWGNLPEKEALHEVLLFCQNQWESLLQLLFQQQEGRSIMQEIFRVPVDIHTSDENIFLFYGMGHMNSCREHYPASEQRDLPMGIRIEKCLLQYLRVKNYIFGCIVQKKSIRGLDFFQKEYYEKDSKFNKLGSLMTGRQLGADSMKAYWEQAMRKQFQNSDLKKIEFRMSIDDKESGLRRDVYSFLKAYRDVIRADYCEKRGEHYFVRRSFPRVGLVFHLLKKKDETVPEKCMIDGADDKEKMQFGILQERYCGQIAAMRRLRDEVQGLDRYIVGIDAASLENATPVWAFVKAYGMARDSSTERVGYGEKGNRSLRFTFHAGEDFRHILSGLRRMDEAVTFLKFHAGDRIGHGTALGILPEQWRQSNPFVVLPRIEALENYIWAHYVLSKDAIHFNATLMAYIEERVHDLAKEIYGSSQGLSIQILTEGYRKMFEKSMELSDICRKAEDVGFCKQVQEQRCDEILWNGEKAAFARHCRKFLVQMEQPINYEVTEQDMQITETLQKLLRQKLSRQGIIVEINPSSNVAIGEIDKITDNQIYRLNRPDGEDNVMVCINSDDPTVFHTNVSNELAYVYYGMLHNSVSREQALVWIDKVRECGMKSSFLQGEEADQQIYDRLDEMVEAM